MKKTQPSLLGDLAYYARTHKRYWLVPLIAVFVIFGVLVAVAQVMPMVSPFIYTLF